MNDKINLEEIDIFITYLEIYIISICTYYVSLKIINSKEKNKVLLIFFCGFISIICAVIKFQTNLFYSMMILIFMLAIFFSKLQKKDMIYSIIILTFSLSMNYVILFLSILVSFLPNCIMKTQNDYICFVSLMIFYIIFIYGFTRIKRFKNGLVFIKNKLENEYFNLSILNISIIVLFFAIIISNYKEKITGRIGIGFVIFSIMMIVTIQKSLQLYYKQKLLIQDLEETKKELANKNKEIKELEEENLNFSKTSHSIMHKQKALEYKLNELMLKTEVAEEMDLKDMVENVTKELKKETKIPLSKTDISEIDDMLQYMQSECVKKKIDFQLQLNGNIHHMINNYVEKEELEILIADHIKNSIIAINHSDNSNKSILVRLGEIDGIYSFYIYDSGIEFEIDTLLNLGKIPSSTHKDDGGTGMGFMNTFDTIRKHKASIIINEYNKPCKDNYTKAIIFKFNKKNEFIISSYRAEEIQKKNNDNRPIIYKI